MTADETIVAYQIAEETDDGKRTPMRARTSDGADVLLFFLTREQAEKYCMVNGVSRPWPIDALTLLELKAFTYEALKDGARYACFDPFGARGECVDITEFFKKWKKA
jgi:hypothetical protein